MRPRKVPLCRSLDGKEFKVGEAPQPPLHWLCRSFLVPIFKNEALNKALHESKDNTRIARIDTEGRWINHRDGTRSKTFDKLRVKFPHADMNYNQWMSSMVKSGNPADRSFAKEVLGPTRFNLVKSGKLKMESLYYAGKLRTIKELKELIK